MSEEDVRLARSVSRENWGKLVDLRNQGVYTLYTNLGLTKTMQLTGWSKQSIMNFVRKHRETVNV